MTRQAHYEKHGLELEGKEPWLSAARTLLRESGCTIRTYRNDLTGTAWVHMGMWWIDVPRPTTERRFGVFAHEVGHHVLHRPDRGGSGKPRWLEEVEAWEYALDAVSRFELPGKMVGRDASESIEYAVKTAQRRGATDFAALDYYGYGYLLDPVPA